jgi:hydrogenase maturation protein HypF
MFSETTRRLALAIHGAVQGVGFRPFVYRLAAELALTGWVINDSRGVQLEVEGDPARLAEFLQRVSAAAPSHAHIIDVTAAWLPAFGYANFEIRHSEDQGAKTVLVLPDLATCPACLADVLDPANRRHRYPFTNCTDCGPRFSIVEALPYDRPNTTMRGFVLCPACRAEYEDPHDRRFHAQPNACPVCGPQLTLFVRSEDSLTQRRKDAKGLPAADALHNSQFTIHHSQLSPPLADARGSDDLAPRPSPLARVAAFLHAGAIVALKGLGGFQLLVDARNEAAVLRLRERKLRPDKPFAVMARDLAQAQTLCHIDTAEAALLTSAQAPIVLLPRRADAALAEAVAPGNPNLGVMLPCTPLHHLLLREVDFPLVATSGNLSDEPICIDNDEAVARLGHIADAFLLHDRPIARHVDDSVLWLVDERSQFLRRARGYAPLPVQLPQPAPTILAVGAHLKNTVALSVERQVFISQHIGDLESAESLAAFERVIADFLRLYAAAPVAIAYDLHPEYLSTKWAIEQGVAADRPSLDGAWHDELHSAFRIPHSLIPVQHHHAHLAACLADNGFTGSALGVIWDGTGYGPDGAIWGGEFLLGNAAGYRRVAHLRPFQLPGGEAAVREPRRVALALLWALLGDTALERDDLAPIRDFAPHERQVLAQMLRRGLNAPVTTSAGRLFDGVAALLGLRQTVSFEGQAAMALEFACAPGVEDAYPFPLMPTGAGEPAHLLDWQPLLAALLDDLKRGVDRGIMAARFHNAAVASMVAVAQAAGEPVVVLSGGCFQNRRLTEQAAARLRQAGFTVLLHRQVPPNDGCISLGQVAVAAKRSGQ